MPPSFDRDSFNGTVVDRWRAVAQATPDAIAIGGPGLPLTYAELDARSDRVAAAISRVPDAVRMAGDPVLVLAPHEAIAIVAILSVWKAGGAVVVLDPALPCARLKALAEASSAVLCLATDDLAARARPTGVSTVLSLSEADSASPRASAVSVPSPRIGPETLAHVVFTSGSTGAPKGVCYSQRTLLHDSWSRNSSGWVLPNDVIAEPLPLAFAAGFHDVLGVLLSGGQIRLTDPRSGGISEFVRWLGSAGVTGLLATPNLLLSVASDLSRGESFPESLRVVRSTGERFLSRDARRVLDRLPVTCELINILGSSETGLLASYRVTRDTPDTVHPLPVGWPMPDKTIKLVGDGEYPILAEEGDEAAGRMIVQSAFTASGYQGDPDQTALVFLGDPASAGEESPIVRTVVTGDLMVRHSDGCLELLGRRDHTVKIRGYRVDPGEIESALLTCPDVREALVVGQERERGGTRLIAYVTGYDGRTVRPAAVRRWLRSRVASYMVPEYVVQLDELPRNERGKLDRAALPPPEGLSTDYVPPMNEWEDMLALLWSDILGVEKVGRDDDFFELGGDSLTTEELLAQLSNEYRVNVQSQVLVSSPTLAAFARRAVRSEHPAFPNLISVRPGGSRPPLFCVAGGGAIGLSFLPLARRLREDRPVWALQARGLEAKRAIPDWSVGRLAARHIEALRSVQRQGPYHLVGHSFGGIVAFEMAQQLRDAGQEVALLAVLDSFAPDQRPRAVPLSGSSSRLRRLAGLALIAGTGIIPTPGHGHYHRYHRQSAVLTRRYRGRPWPGRTLVVTADIADMPGRGAEWGLYLTGQWQIKTLPGDHHSMLREPYVAVLAETIESVLRELEPASVATPSLDQPLS